MALRRAYDYGEARWMDRLDIVVLLATVDLAS